MAQAARGAEIAHQTSSGSNALPGPDWPIGRCSSPRGAAPPGVGGIQSTIRDVAIPRRPWRRTRLSAESPQTPTGGDGGPSPKTAARERP